MVFITVVTGACKPTNITGGPYIVGYIGHSHNSTTDLDRRGAPSPPWARQASFASKRFSRMRKGGPPNNSEAMRGLPSGKRLQFAIWPIEPIEIVDVIKPIEFVNPWKPKPLNIVDLSSLQTLNLPGRVSAPNWKKLMEKRLYGLTRNYDRFGAFPQIQQT